jgi:hypothetical protein
MGILPDFEDSAPLILVSVFGGLFVCACVVWACLS